MSWKDSLRQGSFRGFEFITKTSKLSGGRRSVQHEYPNREKPFTEDLGRVGKSYEIEGYVLGDDYFEAKTRLLEVFEKKGPGELIHPYYGSIIVQVGSLNISESTLEGAIAFFSVTFYEAGDNQFPSGYDDKGAILAEKSDIALANAKTDFDENFSVSGMPAFAIQSSRDLVLKSQKQFEENTKAFSDVAEGVAELSYSTRNLAAEVDDLLQSPDILSQRLLDSFQLMDDSISSALGKTNALDAFLIFAGDIPVTGETPIRIRERSNEATYQNFMRRVAAIKSSQSAIVADYPSLQDAENARVKITDTIESQIREIDPDDGSLWQSLVDVNASLVDALPDIDADIPSLQTVITDSDTSSLEFSYDQFESIDNESDLITRNKIRNPSFIGMGSSLDILDVNR